MQVCFFTIISCNVLMRIEFKLGVSVFQSRHCSLEIFGNVFATSRSFFFGNIDIMTIMEAPVVHCF